MICIRIPRSNKNGRAEYEVKVCVVFFENGRMLVCTARHFISRTQPHREPYFGSISMAFYLKRVGGNPIPTGPRAREHDQGYADDDVDYYNC